MENMFNGCSELTLLNLSNFITTKVIKNNNMFNDCSGLKIVDLSNFNTTKMSPSDIFYGCLSLEYISLENSILNNYYVNLFNTILNQNENITVLTKTGVVLNGTEINISCNNYRNYKYFFGYNKIINGINSKIMCKLCGDNFFPDNGIYDNTYINCNLIHPEDYISDINIYETNEMKINETFYDSYFDTELINNTNEINNSYFGSFVGSGVIKKDDTYYDSYSNIEILTKIIEKNNTIYDSYSTTELIISEIKTNNNIFDLFMNTESIISTIETSNDIFDYYSINKSIINKTQIHNTKFDENIYTELLTSQNQMNNTIYNSYNKESAIGKNQEQMNNYNVQNSEEISNIIFISIYNNNQINRMDMDNKSNIEKLKKYLLNNYNVEDILYQDFQIENILISLSTIKIQINNFNTNKTGIDLGECEKKIKLKFKISENDTLFIYKID